MKTIWLRAEVKEYERRTPLTPEGAKTLLDLGINIKVEKFSERIFSDEEYRNAGCQIVEADSWHDASPDDFVLGLKELAEKDFPLTQNHIYFAHAFKGQEGSKEILERFKQGQGTLFDLEYLTDSNSKRVAAFGYWAGYVGASVAVRAFHHRLNNGDTQMPSLKSAESKSALNAGLEFEKDPKVIIIGANGRCGQGAKKALSDIGLNATEWDYEETKHGGPFSEILEHDIFINTALILKKIPPFLNFESLTNEQNLSLITDVSCDPTGDLNPIPLYKEITSWEKPLHQVSGFPKLEIISIDNLPSLLPRESSEDFGEQLLPHLINLMKEGKSSPVWKSSHDVFQSFKKL